MPALLILVVALLLATPAAAQQGSLQVNASAQATTGETARLNALGQVEPDLGVRWLQPRTRFGTVQLEFHGTERKNELHAGRIYGSLRDLKFGNYTWTVEGGDTYYAPAIGGYQFSNLTTPVVTFVGGSVSAHNARTSIGIVAGQGTVWRNIFGTDADTLDQTILGGRATHRASDRLDVNARVSRIRTEDLDEHTHSIAASDQAGGGVRYIVTPSIQVIADGSVVAYRRAGSTSHERDGSGLVGLHWLHSRGWLQVNASRFSPGDSPTLVSTLPDRSGQFAAGELDLVKRIRVFGGWEAFRQNLDPSAAQAAGYPIPRSDGTRQYGGVRAQVGGRSTVSFRLESGDRISKYISGRQDVESDTGAWGADWQASFARMSGFARFAQRSNVTSANRDGSYTQRDLSGQLFYRMSTSAQVFGQLTTTHTTDQGGGGSTYWQAGGGAQLQVVRKGLWLRTEGTMSRHADLVTQSFVPRESLSLGLNGYVTSRTSLGVDVYLDRATTAALSGNPWATRSMVRLVHTLPTGAAYAPAGSGLFRSVPVRAVATVKGVVYADWNRNGLQDAGEDPVAGVPLQIEGLGAAESSKNGEFLFKNVPDGFHEVGLDLGALPIDFDAPAIPRLQVALSGHDTRQLAFGLIPLGSIRGRIVRDLNGNGTADSTDPAIDDAVVVLDGGKRSERSKRGQVRIRGGSERGAFCHAAGRVAARRRAHRWRGDTGRNARAWSHGSRRTVCRIARKACRNQEGVSGGRSQPEAEARHPGASRWQGSAEPCTGRSRANTIRVRCHTESIVSGFDAGHLRSAGRGVRRPDPRPPDGCRPHRQGAAGLSGRAAAERSELALSGARGHVRESHRRGTCVSGCRSADGREGVGD